MLFCCVLTIVACIIAKFAVLARRYASFYSACGTTYFRRDMGAGQTQMYYPCGLIAQSFFADAVEVRGYLISMLKFLRKLTIILLVSKVGLNIRCAKGI